MWSKKVKLPKKMWEYGRSKFLFCRLAEDSRHKLTMVSTPSVNIIKRLIMWLKGLWRKSLLVLRRQVKGG